MNLFAIRTKWSITENKQSLNAAIEFAKENIAKFKPNYFVKNFAKFEEKTFGTSKIRIEISCVHSPITPPHTTPEMELMYFEMKFLVCWILH